MLEDAEGCSDSEFECCRMIDQVLDNLSRDRCRSGSAFLRCDCCCRQAALRRNDSFADYCSQVERQAQRLYDQVMSSLPHSYHGYLEERRSAEENSDKKRRFPSQDEDDAPRGETARGGDLPSDRVRQGRRTPDGTEIADRRNTKTSEWESGKKLESCCSCPALFETRARSSALTDFLWMKNPLAALGANIKKFFDALS